MNSYIPIELKDIFEEKVDLNCTADATESAVVQLKEEAKSDKAAVASGGGRLKDYEYRTNALKDANIEHAANFNCPKGKKRSFCPCGANCEGRVVCADAFTADVRKEAVRILRKKIFGAVVPNKYKERQTALYNELKGMLVITENIRRLEFRLNGVNVCKTYYKVRQKL